MKNLLMILTTRHRTRTAGLAAIALLSFGCGNTAPGSAGQAESAQPAASSAPSSLLGAAGSFAALAGAGTAVTCTGGTVTGDVGVFPTGAITQTEGCTISGTLNPPGTGAQAAYIDFISAYGALAITPCTTTIAEAAFTGAALGPFAPGVYCFPAAVTFTNTTLTLSGSGIWIFKVGAALTGSSFKVVMQDGVTPPPCNSVYWWVGAAATMTDSNFVGTILAGAAIDITRGTFDGHALAQAAVTMTNAAVSACGGGTPSPGCKDFVTGGGWIDRPNGRWANFAVTGGFKHGKLFGHLTYVDHAPKDSKGKDANDSKSSSSTCDGIKVKGTGVTAYTVTGENARHIEGTADINGKSGYTYQVDVVDNGEPGIDDKFSLSLSNGCSVSSGEHLAGNIQLHKMCRPLICAPFKSDKDDDEGEGWHEVHDGRD